MKFNQALDNATDVYLNENRFHDMRDAHNLLINAINAGDPIEIDEVIMETNEITFNLPKQSRKVTIHAARTGRLNSESEEDEDGEKSSIEHAADIASDYEDEDSTGKMKHDRMTGGAGKKAGRIIRNYNNTAVQGATKTLNKMKQTMKKLG
tara:strand:- start:26549 stop:27001 length:453 start_codon:yes stop_codon:yes gene_type:complete